MQKAFRFLAFALSVPVAAQASLICAKTLTGVVGANPAIHLRVESRGGQVFRVTRFDSTTDEFQVVRTFENGVLVEEKFPQAIRRYQGGVQVYDELRENGFPDAVLTFEIRDGKLVQWRQWSTLYRSDRSPKDGGEMVALKITGIFTKTAQLVGERSGKIYAQCEMSRGQLHGQFRWVDPDTGIVVSEGQFDRNRRVGVWSHPRFNYDSMTNLEIDGHWTMEWDSEGRSVSSKDSDGREHRWERDQAGNVTKRTGKNKDGSSYAVEVDPFTEQTLSIESFAVDHTLKRRQVFCPDTAMCLRDETYTDGKLTQLEVYDPTTRRRTRSDGNGKTLAVSAYDPATRQFRGE